MSRLSPHLIATLALALPLIGSNLARVAIGVVDTLMLGRYSVDALAALVLANSVFMLIFLAGSGYAIGVMGRIAAALAREDDMDVRRATRMALWLSGLHSALVLPLMWWSGPVLAALGQEPQIAALGQDWLRVMGFAMPAVLCGMTLSNYLATLGRANTVLWVTLAGLPVNAALNWLLIFGPGPFPEWGVTGAAIASLTVNWLQLATLAVYAAWLPAARHHTLFARFWKPDWSVFRSILALGLPIGLTIVAEVGMFTGANVMMGWLGADALAAHGITLQIASLTFMVHLGIASAATIRVGTAKGRGSAPDLRDAAKAATILSAGFAVATMALFLLVPEWLTGLYLDPDNPRAPGDRGAGGVADAVCGAVPDRRRDAGHRHGAAARGAGHARADGAGGVQLLAGRAARGICAGVHAGDRSQRAVDGAGRRPQPCGGAADGPILAPDRGLDRAARAGLT